MAMVCPVCHDVFTQRLDCPQCDVRLVLQDHSRSPGLFSSRMWQQTPWGRILIGLVLAQGLFHGLRHFVAAGFLATGLDQNAFWESLNGLMTTQALQLVGLVIGGVLAGAGQQYGIIYGAVLGVWNGVMLLLINPNNPYLSTHVTLYGIPLLQAGVGALAGWVGGRIWMPLTPVTPAGHSRKITNVVRSNSKPLFQGPISWVRVIMWVGLAVGGTLWADVVLDFVIKASDNHLSRGSKLQAQLITWEITALAILAGGALAGAGSPNGFKQGLAVGLGSAIVLAGIRMASPASPSLDLLVLSSFGPMILAIIGGGFGGQLLPPVMPFVQRRFADI